MSDSPSITWFAGVTEYGQLSEYDVRGIDVAYCADNSPNYTDFRVYMYLGGEWSAESVPVAVDEVGNILVRVAPHEMFKLLDHLKGPLNTLIGMAYSKDKYWYERAKETAEMVDEFEHKALGR